MWIEAPTPEILEGPPDEDEDRGPYSQFLEAEDEAEGWIYIFPRPRTRRGPRLVYLTSSSVISRTKRIKKTSFSMQSFII